MGYGPKCCRTAPESDSNRTHVARTRPSSSAQIPCSAGKWHLPEPRNFRLDDLFQGVSVVVGDQRPRGRLSGLVVVPDRGGQGEDALQHTRDDPCRGVPTVAFQVELAFEGVVDRLDDLPQRAEQVRAGPVGFALASRTQQPYPV